MVQRPKALDAQAEGSKPQSTTEFLKKARSRKAQRHLEFILAFLQSRSSENALGQQRLARGGEKVPDRSRRRCVFHVAASVRPDSASKHHCNAAGPEATLQPHVAICVLLVAYLMTRAGHPAEIDVAGLAGHDNISAHPRSFLVRCMVRNLLLPESDGAAPKKGQTQVQQRRRAIMMKRLGQWLVLLA